MHRFAARLLAASLLLAAPVSGADGHGSRTLEGEYSSGFGNGTVRATFTPDGGRSWKVRFDFVFNGQPYTYRGTAEGSLEDGTVAGRVQNERRHRTFTFRGEFEDGVLRGTHAEIVRGRERPTGKLVLEE